MAALALGATILFCALLAAGYRAEPLWALVPIAAVGAIAERGRIRFTSNIELSISLLPTVFVAIVFGPLAAMVVAAAAMLGDLRRPYLRWLTYTFSESITAGVTGLAVVYSANLYPKSIDIGSIAV